MSTEESHLNVFKMAQMLAGLNDEQREAAMTIDGRYLVLAGAGSGKTTVLTNRIANMLVNNVKPSSIFCATFTNKASREMRERLENIVGKDSAEKVWMGTFHSLCVRILRKHGHLLGYTQKDNRCNFIIYDSYDVLTTIERIYKIMNIGNHKPGVAMHYIDNAKNNLWTPEYCLYHNADSAVNETMAHVYTYYQRMLKEANAMDFGDLIMNVVTLLEEFPDAAEYWQNKFEYVLVDEYQDTNPAQFQLLVKLAQPHLNIFAVGDHDQSIYKFRGSDISIIMNFEKHFSPCRIIKLERNYRSVQNIVQAGNGLISNNTSPYDKILVSQKEEGELIDIVEVQNEYKEAAFVAAKMKQMVVNEGYEWKDFAILYRSGYQSAPFEQLFIHNFIPFKIIGGVNFFDREEIKDLISYLRVIYNRKDDAAMLRILNKPARGIGKTTENHIEEYASKHGVSIHRALRSLSDIPTIKKAAQGKINTFLNTLDVFEEELNKNRTLLGFSRYVIDHSGLMKHYRERASKDKKDEERLENIEQLLMLIQHYENENPDKTLDDFLQEMSLLTDYENPGEEENSVRLMTMHGSKGLEFPVVFAVGWNELIFPSWRSQGSEEVEEERRLAYVAITRAEEKLFISHVTERQRPDGRGVQKYNPSRFIGEIPEEIARISSIS